jgi:nucleotide-binding universal stress UspA family protein
MRNIVVPTAFSDNALVALRYAINIANQFGSTIHLVNGIDIVSSTGIYTDVNKMLTETAKRKLADIVIRESRSLGDLSLMVSKTLRGEITSTICDYANKVHADLIVMGTQGATGLKEIFIGTTALGVIKNAKG